MKPRIALPVLLLAVVAGSHAAAQQAGETVIASETLLIERVRQPGFAASLRGQTAAQVAGAFGEPAQKLEPRGGQKPQWPVIQRWVYPDFTVYFEKNRVIDVVANKLAADEIGPKPATQ